VESDENNKGGYADQDGGCCVQRGARHVATLVAVGTVDVDDYVRVQRLGV
jgi:hypothetical protein